MANEPRYWFPAKRYGWGWGPPVTWQGWLVTGLFVLLTIAAIVHFDPRRDLPGLMTSVLLLSLGLIAVCWWKGEPPRWRWGEDEDRG